MSKSREDDPFGVAAWTSAQMAQMMLRDTGTVPPFGIAFIGSELKVETVFPLQGAPKDFTVSWLFEQIHERLCAIVEQHDVRAVSTTLIDLEGGRVFVQVELPDGPRRPFVFCPTKIDGEWFIGEPEAESPDHLVAAPVFQPGTAH